ncbi:S8 family serine peptidase [Phyllobacterium meliloti]|uniref:S8 family serine peptidase n=1 Tax=Phyllobacterium meliloti TaxID=555317 RepID=UPI001D133E44|nr:S8 family serine peptidase [Phyllobacterium sp. T1293]UGX86875.1 S8 family serine peptidase [Phyllobacterium sp. T1293]
MSFHATDAGFSACSARLSKFRKHLMSSVCAGLIIAGAGAGAFGQEQKLPYVQARIKGDREVFRTPEYFANWGLDVHHFDAAYAANATGQGVKLGEFDAGVYVDHPDFYNKTIQGFGKPLIDGTTPEFEKDEKRPEFHGTHVAGTMIANKDGLGMHGGAFGSNDFFTGYFLSYGKLSDKASGDAIIQSGVSFINNSWGPDFDNYRIARQYGVVGPSVSDLGEYNGYRNIRLATEPLLRANPEYSAVILDVIDKALEKQRGRNVDASLAKAAINGVGIVFAAGNDRLYSSSLVLNKFGLRPRLFRGISVGDSVGKSTDLPPHRLILKLHLTIPYICKFISRYSLPAFF